MKESWDKLANKFNTHKDDEIDPGAADNIVIAWPVILSEINKNFKQNNNEVLDYGCGTGGFSNKLNSLGFQLIDCIDIVRSKSNDQPIYMDGIFINQKK